MNVLCHLAMSGGDSQLAIGQFLGDFTRGPVEELPFPPGVLQGIRDHRRIDAMTEQHEYARWVRQLLPRQDQRYGGIVLDLYCDYLLHLAWGELMPIAKDICIPAWTHLLCHPPITLPRAARKFAAVIDRFDLLSAYADPEEIRDALRRIGQRLRKPRDLSPLLEPLVEHQAELREGFPGYFLSLKRGLAQ